VVRGASSPEIRLDNHLSSGGSLWLGPTSDGTETGDQEKEAKEEIQQLKSANNNKAIFE